MRALLGREARRGRLLDHLLVAALHRAVALAQADHVAVVVGEHLELDVARLLQEFLHVDLVVAERGQRLGPRHAHRVQQRRLAVHDAHAAAAAAARRLDDDRVADVVGDAQEFVAVSAPSGPSEPGTQGTPAAFIVLIAETLSPIRRIVSGARADEREAALLDALGEVGVLGQEAVARVDGDRVGDLGRADDRGHVEVAVARRRRADADGLVGEQHVLQVAVGRRVHGDGLDAEFAAGAEDAQRDLAAIGDDDLVEHRRTCAIR